MIGVWERDVVCTDFIIIIVIIIILYYYYYYYYYYSSYRWISTGKPPSIWW